MISKRERTDREALVRKLKRLFDPSQYDVYKLISKKTSLQDRVTDEALKAAGREIRKIAKEEGTALTAAQAADIAGLLVWGWKELTSPLEVPEPKQ